MTPPNRTVVGVSDFVLTIEEAAFVATAAEDAARHVMQRIGRDTFLDVIAHAHANPDGPAMARIRRIADVMLDAGCRAAEETRT